MKWLILLLYSTGTFAGILSTGQIISSVTKHYPLILQAQYRKIEARESLREKKGAFDLRLEGKADTRVDGFYDGNIYGLKLVKPFRTFNTKLYGGFRRSDGLFPSYEGKADTLDEGEYMIGAEFSLLRNRFMHEKQFLERLARLKLEKAGNKLEVTQNMVKEQALITYWSWVIAGKSYQIFDDLLKVAEKRQSNLKRRYKRGALAKIQIIENMQYITERRSKRAKAKQVFDNLAIELSLFYRDDEGKPKAPLSNQIPELEWSNFVDKLEKDISFSEERLLKNPKFLNFEVERQEIERSIEFAENSLLPELNFRVESTEDRGEGSSSLEGRENRIMLSLDIPLERNLGKGAIAKEKARMKRLNTTQSFMQETTIAKAQMIKNKITMSKEVIKNALQEVDFAQQLLKAENKLFNNGNSDFFVLNMREQKLAQARQKKLISFLDYMQSFVELNQLYWNF